MSARTLSRVARKTSACETSTPLACALALILSPSAFSVAPQLPSSAATSSPFAAIGQFGFAQEAPSAFFATMRSSSLSAPKKSFHSASTEFGSLARAVQRSLHGPQREHCIDASDSDAIAPVTHVVHV